MLIDLANDQLLVSKIKSVWPNRSNLKVKLNTVRGHLGSPLQKCTLFNTASVAKLKSKDFKLRGKVYGPEAGPLNENTWPL